MTEIKQIPIKSLIYEIYDNEVEREFVYSNFSFFKEQIMSLNNILRVALEPDCKAIIAGGMARWLLFGLQDIKRNPRFADNFNADLKAIKAGNLLYTICFKYLQIYFDELKGDVDVFFKNEGVFRELANIRSSDWYINRITDFAISYSNQAQLKYFDITIGNLPVQHIKYLFGEPVKILESFDIENGQIAIDFVNDSVYYNSDILTLEKTQRLSLNKENINDSCFHRIDKYIHKYHYKELNETNNTPANLIYYATKRFNDYKQDEEKNKIGYGFLAGSLKKLIYHSSFFKEKDLLILNPLIKKFGITISPNRISERSNVISLKYLKTIGESFAFARFPI